MTAPAAPVRSGWQPRHWLSLVTVTIVVIGCLAVLSAADGASHGSPFMYFAKAVVFGTLGCAGMIWLGRNGLPRATRVAFQRCSATIPLSRGCQFPAR